MRLKASTVAWLAGTIGGSLGGARPFVEAVTLQLARRGADETLVARRVADLLLDPEAAGASTRLAADPEMLSSFFQNADLLYEHGYPDSDAVSLLVMSALETLDPPV